MQRCRAAAEPFDTLCAVSRAVLNAPLMSVYVCTQSVTRLRFSMCLRNEGVLLIGPLDDDISKSTAAERRLLDFSGGLFFHVGYLFCTDWSKKVCSISYHDSLCRIPERTDSFWPIKVSPCFNFETRPWFLLQGSDVFCFSAELNSVIKSMMMM